MKADATAAVLRAVEASTASGIAILWAALAFAVVLGDVDQTLAQSAPRPALHWSRAPGAEQCVDPRSLAERVETITGPVFVSASDADFSIEGHIDRPSPTRVHVRISISHDRGQLRGTRDLTFDQSECRAVDATVALVIAVMIDPALGSAGLPDLDVLGPSEQPPEQALLEELQAGPRPAPQPKPERSPPTPKRELHPQPTAADLEYQRSERIDGPPWEVGVGAGFASDLFPQTAVKAELSGHRVLFRHLDLGLALTAAFAVNAAYIDAQHSTRSRAFGLRAWLCPRTVVASWLLLRACAGPELGVVTANGVGFSTNRVGVLPSYGLAGRVGAEVQLQRSWRIATFVGARVNFSRNTFDYGFEGTGQPAVAYRLDTTAAEAELGVVYAF